MSLYLEHRPLTLEQIKGNKETVSALTSFLSNPKKMPLVYLFHGPSGCGKTTFGRIIGNALEIAKQDVVELDSAQFNGIDTVREIRKNCQYKPLKSSYRLYILDEVHMFSSQAQEGMLKILEDTPKHTIFILCTTNPEKLKPTLRGRCQQFQVKPLEDLEMKKLLKQVARKEGTKLESEVIEQVIQTAEGHSRLALQTLEQVINTEPDKRLEAAKKVAEQTSQAIELSRLLFKKASWQQVSKVLQGLKGQDAEGIRRVVMGYASAVLVNNYNENAHHILVEFEEPTYNNGFNQIVLSSANVIKS